MSSWNCMNMKCQGHSLTLVQGHSDSRFSNCFFLETAWPIKAKFYVEPPWDSRTKIWSNGPAHMTKLAVMPIHGKNISTSTSLESKDRWTWKLVCSIGYLSSTKFVKMMTLGWPWPILWQGQIWYLILLYGKKVKQWTFFRKPLYKRWYMQSTKWVALWVQKVKVIHWPWSISFSSIFLNFFFPTADFNISSAFRWAIQDQWSSGYCFLSCQAYCVLCCVNALKRLAVRTIM